LTRIHSELNEGELRFVAKPLFCKFASINTDGSAHVTPTWSMYEDGRFIFSIPASAVKIRNIVRDDRVTLLFDDAYSWVAVKGRARINVARNVRLDTEKLAIRYMGRRQGEKMAAEIVKREHHSVEVVPESVVSENV
jgi:PPOX class probable F420-dependent enzyme